MKKNQTYDASNIKVLTAFESIQKRPGMYIGDIEGGSGLANMILEAVNFYLGDFYQNQCSKISIVIYENNDVEVSDNRRGLPSHLIDGKPFIEKMMTGLHVSKNQGLYSIALAIVNALSAKVLITTTRDGFIWTQNYKYGTPGSLKKMGKAHYSGTSIRFQPSKEHFPQMFFDQSFLTNRLQELSYFNENLEISFEDRSIRKAKFYSPKGLTDCVSALYMKKRGIYKGIEVIKIAGRSKDVELEVAFGFVTSCGKQLSFVNGIKSIEGGTHVNGFIAGIAQAIKIVSGCKLNASIWKRFIQEGVLSAINIKLLEPRYAISTRDLLTNPEVFSITKKIISKQLVLFLKENDSKCNKLLNKYIEQYIQFQYRKINHECGCTSSKFVEKILSKMFDKPDKYKKLVEQYKEVEMYLAECKKMQDAE